MPQESFLARRKFGVRHWMIIALIACFCVGWIPRGVRKSIRTNSNNAADWLPANYTESKELLWFRDHFISAQFVLASWEGCTLGDTDRLRLLSSKLRAVKSETGEPLFDRVITGPEMIAQLTEPPSNLDRADAIERLEGAIVGPPRPGPDGAPGGADSRYTCLVAYLSAYSQDGNLQMREAVERVERVAVEECGIGQGELHLGGPPVDNITIDIEGEKTLRRLAFFSGLVGLGLAYWFFRSLPVTLAVFYVAGASAGASLAAVYYYGVVVEQWLGGRDGPHLGTVDAILLSMPAVVYVLGLAGAIHLVNYYRDERDAHGVDGAVERAVRIAWGPCTLAAFTTAVGLGSLAFSDIIPIKKFGGFTAAGVMISIGVLFSVLPVFLHVFPPKLRGDDNPDDQQRGALPSWAARYRDFVTTRHGLVTAGCLTLMAVAALGLPRITTQVQLLKLLDPGVKLISDYAWLEEHLGNLVPMEVVVAITQDQTRTPDEPAEGPDGRYRLTMYERMQLARRLERRIERLGDVSRAMSAATFGPAEAEAANWSERRSREYTTSNALEQNRGALKEFMRYELSDSDRPRELWRVSAKVAALADIDYGEFVGELREAVEPVLEAYHQRDMLVKALASEQKPLVGSRVCVAYYLAGKDSPQDDSPAALLIDLLEESRGGRGRVIPLNVAQLEAADPPTQQQTLAALRQLDAVVAVSDQAQQGLNDVDGALDVVPPLEVGPHEAPHNMRESPAFQPERSLAAVYSGIVPLVYKTQRELLASLRESILWATALIAGVMMALFRNVLGGLVSMLPNVFPVVLVFGCIGWLGIKVDIGIMMTASVALGVAVDDTIHFLTWFRRGLKRGLTRRDAVRMAFDRCSVAMTQTTLIAGLGLAVFSTSTFTPTQQFGMLMITILSAALVGDLVMLPALLCGPIGWAFSSDRKAAAAAAPSVDAPAEPAPPTEPAPEPMHIQTPKVDPDADDPPRAPQESLSPSNAALHAKLKRLRKAAGD